MKSPFWLNTVVVVLTIALSTGAAHALEAPRAALIALNADLTAALESQDPEALHARMLDSVALDIVCQRVLGQGWDKSSAAQREVLRDHILQLLVNAYSGAMENAILDEVQYETLKHSANSALIAADIPTVKGNLNQVKFRLTVQDQRWLVKDVMVEGISLVTVFRASFNSILERQGVEALIAHLNKRYAVSSS